MGPLELIALVILALLLFGPDRLPEVIQKAAGALRRVRQFSDSAQEDIRSQLGPEYQDLELGDLHPKTFVRKHLLEDGDLGLPDIRSELSGLREAFEPDAETRGKTPEPSTRTADPPPGSGASPPPGKLPPFDTEAT